MSSWLFRSLVVLYPKAWRERYSKEVGDLSAELLAVGATTRLHLALELARSALAERVRSLRRGRFIVVLSGSAALVVVVMAALLATNGFGLAGSASPRASLVGWSVSYRGAQVSVPPSAVAHGTGPGGDPWVNFQPISPPATGGTCMRPFGGTILCLLPMRQVPPAYADEKPTTINGVPVYLGPKGDYYAPSLGVEVTASGPLASRVVATLTRSLLPQLCSRHGSRHLVCMSRQALLSSTMVSLSTITRG
jgi:hypothetical protein